MEDKKVIIQKENHIATVTINEPKTLNALNSKLLDELGAAFDTLAADKDVRAIILTGVDRAFVAGANIQEMSGLNYEEAKVFGAKGASVFRKIETCPQPVIAAVNGFALGGGSELALACDIRIASEKAKFGQPEVGLGITPGFSGNPTPATHCRSGKSERAYLHSKSYFCSRSFGDWVGKSGCST